MIPVLKPSFSDAEAKAVTKVLKSGWWGNGPVCQEFERRLTELTGYRYSVTVNSATAALHLACILAGVGEGDEVIVPALTFVSSGLAPLYCGAKVVLADIHPDTLCIDWNSAQQLTTPHTKAVIAVDFAGESCHKPAGWSIPIIEDAAHMPLAPHYGRWVTYSFHPVKPIATGDGGAVLTNSQPEYEQLKQLRWCGISLSTWDREQKSYNWDYTIEDVGYKYHWNDVQAAIGLVQLDRFEDMQRRRLEIVERYWTELAKLPIQFQSTSPRHGFHLFVIKVDPECRDSVVDYFREAGIAVGVHYKPLNQYRIFGDQLPLPVVDRVWRQLISLPIHPDLTDKDQTRVIETLKGFFG
jgi:perosamine synthetase